MKFFIIPHLRKCPDKIVLHVGTNNAPHATPEEMFDAIEDLKSFMQKYAPESKIIISMPVLQVDKANANDINRRYIDLLKEAKVDCIFNDNIAESNIDQYGLHINESGSVILAKNLISGIRNFWKKWDSQKRILVYNLNGRDASINSSKPEYSSKYLKSDSNITDAFTHVEHHSDTITDLRTFCIKYPSNIIIGHLNINSVRNKFELLSFLIGGKIDILLICETKIDSTFPTSQFHMSGFSNIYRLDWNDKEGATMLFVKDSLITFHVSGFCFSEKNRDIFHRDKPRETKMVDILLLQSS